VVSPLAFLLQNGFQVPFLGYDVVPFLQRIQPNDRDTDRQNWTVISYPVSPRFATRCVCCNHSREVWWMNREWLELRSGAQQIKMVAVACDVLADITA
jgi:hypothetical protein